MNHHEDKQTGEGNASRGSLKETFYREGSREIASRVKHTPGPWTSEFLQDKDEIRDIDNSFYRIAGDRGSYDCGVYVASVENVDSSSWPNAEANARLIAAAPELLAALKLLATMDSPDYGRKLIAGEVRDVAQKAIAHAEGSDQ